MNINLKILLTFLLLSLLCGACHKEDISGKLDGVWKTEWDDFLMDGDVDDITVEELLVLKSTDSKGSKGEFVQIFTGEAVYDDWENETSINYRVTVPGEWEVVDKNKLRFKYDIKSMQTTFSKSNLKADYTDAALSLLTGDFEGLLMSAAKESGMKEVNKKINAEVERQVTKFFRDMCHEINKDKKAMTDVEINDEMMNCDVNHGFFGREQVYDRIEDTNEDMTAKAASSTATPRINFKNLL